MQIYDAPLKDIRFLLETFGYDDRVASLPGYEDYDLETVMALMEESGRFCREQMLPLNRKGDQQPLRYNPEDHSVKTPDGFPALYAKIREQGAIGITHPVEYGGAGAPNTVGMILSEMGTATNKSFSMCTGLTHALIDCLVEHGTDEQRTVYLPKLISGEWTGTMCLTEPQCGTDLGLLTTKAEPAGDHYLLTGTKIWITFGEHDLADNIIHLVLARLPDAPEGIRGISLFLVPKFTLDGERNPVYCAGLEHKMGIHASPTCVMSLEGAKGWLVGEAHKGMRAMFVMMNHARLSVGMEGVALGEIAYQTALAFARDRRQGKALNRARQEPGQKADNILVHPDVRRMLMNIKSTNEAMRALGYWCGVQMDVAHHHPDEAVRQHADDLVALMTPIIKSYLTEQGFNNINEAMQVCGGAGYTTDWSIEQYLRDARIAMIYEGTNHVQALDLVGRKLPADNGRLFMAFNKEVSEFIRANKENPALAEFLEPLKAASKRLQTLSMSLGMKGMQDPEEVGAVASPYLNLFALTTLALMWCMQVKAAADRGDRFGETKIKTARYFFAKILPQTDTLAAVIESGKASMMALDPEDF